MHIIRSMLGYKTSKRERRVCAKGSRARMEEEVWSERGGDRKWNHTQFDLSHLSTNIPPYSIVAMDSILLVKSLSVKCNFSENVRIKTVSPKCCSFVIENAQFPGYSQI